MALFFYKKNNVALLIAAASWAHEHNRMEFYDLSKQIL